MTILPVSVKSIAITITKNTIVQPPPLHIYNFPPSFEAESTSFLIFAIGGFSFCSGVPHTSRSLITTSMCSHARMAQMGLNSQSWHSGLDYNKWISLSPSSLRPAARYKHAATVSDDKLYIIGGACKDRYLSDFQVLDLKTLMWSAVKLKMEATDRYGTELEAFPEISGLSMIKWKKRLLLLAGLTKSTTYMVTVRYIDLESYSCGVAETFGNIPVSRRGQSVTPFGSKLIMFGGEDRKGRPRNDVYILDLETMTWSAVETTQKRPTPRFDHVAALHAERYLCIFGGCSRSAYFTDLHVLDLEKMEWSQPPVSFNLVNARAGHAGVVVDGNWYIVGSKSGALETLVINMSTFTVSILTTVKENDPLASEGLSISSIKLGGENFLITFGGYNRKYFNEVFAMRIKPAATRNPPAIKIENIDGSRYTKITRELQAAQEKLIQQNPQNFRNFVNLLNCVPPPSQISQNLLQFFPGSSVPQPQPISSNDEAVQPPPGFAYKEVPQNQLPSLPSPVGSQHVDNAETSTGRRKRRTLWLKVEDEGLANAFMIVSSQSEMKSPSFWVRASKIYNDSKPPGVSRRTSDMMRSKWHSLKNKIYFFNVIYAIVSSEHESTHSAPEMVTLARKKYMDVYRSSFNLVHMWRIVKDHPFFVPRAIDVAACSKKATTSGVINSSSNEEANAGLVSNEDRARIVGNKRNKEGTTKSDTEQLPMQKKARASNSAANQDTNAETYSNLNEADALNTEPLLVPTSVGESNSMPEHDTNAGMNPNNGDAQIIGQEGNETGATTGLDTEHRIENYTNFEKAKLELKKAKIEAMKAKAEAKNRELWLKEYEIVWKDTSQMTEQQRVLHDKACEVIKRRWNSENNI